MSPRRLEPFLAAIVGLVLVGPPAIASAQCCGDCDLDGTVSIAELVGGVKRALDGCDVAPQQRVFLDGLQAQSIETPMDRMTTEGRLAFSIYGWSPISTLFVIQDADEVNLVGLVIDDGVVRLFVRTPPTGFPFPVRYDLEQRLPAPDPYLLAIEAVWRPGKLSLVVNGNHVLRDIPSELVIPQGTVARIGSTRPQSVNGAVYLDLSFSTD